MDKILAIARREFLATVRTKAFILSVVLMPAVIVGALLGTHWVQKLAEEEKMPVRRFAVIDIPARSTTTSSRSSPPSTPNAPISVSSSNRLRPARRARMRCAPA